ncbi:MAG: hypothetical protein ACI9WU_004359 [Myxococcota bacterium]|jgi:hypothetical protein
MIATAATPDPMIDVLSHLPNLARRWPAGPWVWDLRFNCAICNCPTDVAEQARGELEAALPDVCDHTSIASMPDAVRDMVNMTGGLRPGQLVFVGPEGPAGRPFGLWWPWLDGRTVSIRVGLL